MKRTVWLVVAVITSSIILALTLVSPSLGHSLLTTTPWHSGAEKTAEDFQEIIIYLRESADLRLKSLPEGKVARRTEIIRRLQTTAATSQAQLISELEAQQTAGTVLDFEPLWIRNAILAIVQVDLIDSLAARPEVIRVGLNERVRLLSPQEMAAETANAIPAPTHLTWGLKQIRALHAWEGLGIDGSGVTVAIMDTGVDWRHPDLLNNYRGSLPNGSSNHIYNWYDPVANSAVPIDPNGHGTHVAGTAVGSPFIGVAPGAKWIAVRALDANGAGQLGDIHLAFQWLMAPGGNPAKAPDVINNSWTGGPELTEFMPDVAALQAAGIIPIFAAGNLGPNPGTVGAPANYPHTLAIGASDDLDTVTWFSSRGPSSQTSEYKPDFVAPGAHVLSARPDGSYTYLNGTSMATPHAVGAYALVLSANPTLNSDRITTLIKNKAVAIAPAHPNHDSGWGRLDVYSTLVEQVTTGILTGLVLDGGQPVADLTVTITTSSGAQLPFLTGADGRYQAFLLPGTYSVAISRFGYQPVQISNLTVQANQSTQKNINMSQLPGGKVSGTIRRLANGVPLSGTIKVVDTPMLISTSNNGQYNISLPVGQYELIAAVSGYRLGRAMVNVTAGGMVVKDFTLVSGPKTLLVDAGQVKYDSKAAYFKAALVDSGYNFDYWPVRDPNSDAPTLADLSVYDVVVWSDPVDSPGNINASQTLSDYLGLGGNLLISGQNIGQKTQDPNSPPYWWQRQLQGQYLDKATGPFTLTADLESPFVGLTLTLNGPDSAANQIAADIVRPLPNSLTRAAFEHQDGQPGGLYSNFCGPYHIIYLGYGLEGVSGAENRAAVIERSYSYFAQTEPPAGVRFQPESISQLAAPGGRLTYTLSLINRSETLTDTFTLNFGGTGWTTSLITPTVTLGPCHRGETIVTIDVPPSLPLNHLETFWLRAQSGNFPVYQEDLPFTLKAPGKILLVDDDRWFDRKSIYQTALDEAAVIFDFWETDTTNGGWGSPPGELLNYYDIILWYTGYDWFQPITAEESESLYNYLSQGGRLFLSSQDYLMRHPDDPLTSEFIKVRQVTEPITPTAVFGGSELAAWSDLAGPLRLDYGPYQNFSDGLVPDPSSDVSLWHNQGTAAGIVNQGLTAGGEPWRLIFWALPYETLPPDSLTATIRQLIGRLSDLGDSTFEVDRRVASLGGPEKRRTYTITLNNLKVQANQLWMTNTIPAELNIDLATVTGGATYDPQARQLTWQGTLPSGGEHVIDYEAEPDPSLPAGTQIDNGLEIYYPRHSLTLHRNATFWVDAPDLSQSTFTISPENGNPYDTVSYQLVVSNGGLTAAETTSATVRLPDGLGLLTDTLQASAGTIDVNDRVLHWQGGVDLTRTVTVTVMMTTPFETSSLWFPATAVLSDNETAVIVKDSLFFLSPYQSHFPVIAKN